MMNISERYGDNVEATIEDYRELNPDGTFEIHSDGIREYFNEGDPDFKEGTWELIAQ